ncbi:MAG TPA: putative Ig domain-containing protein, partial [Candidatus Methylomirabilis sp.]|nr:putative Ig domain-containing protein [Candidatus Methylomirabilis sp.]
QGMAADVQVNPSDYLATQGKTFELSITIDPKGDAIAGAQLNIAFDKSNIRINKITEGDIFKQNNTDTFFSEGVINNSTGTVINIFGVVIGRTNTSNPGTFIVINATPIGSAGTSGINLSNVRLSNSDAQPVLSAVYNGSITINSPPVLVAIGDKEVFEGQTLTFTLSASDPNSDILTYSVSNLPAGATFNPVTGIFSWTPDFTQSGNYTNVRFEVNDGGLSDYEDIIIKVNHVNRPPTFNPLPYNSSTFSETQSIPISIIANDPDNDTLSYVIRIDGTQVSTSTNYLWITNYSSSGSHNINISVSDGTVSVAGTTIVYINNVYPRYDVNENGIVDIGDLTIIGQHFNEITNAPYPRYDVNMDGIVDILDITISAQQFGLNT